MLGIRSAAPKRRRRRSPVVLLIIIQTNIVSTRSDRDHIRRAGPRRVRRTFPVRLPPPTPYTTPPSLDVEGPTGRVPGRTGRSAPLATKIARYLGAADRRRRRRRSSSRTVRIIIIIIIVYGYADNSNIDDKKPLGRRVQGRIAFKSKRHINIRICTLKKKTANASCLWWGGRRPKRRSRKTSARYLRTIIHTGVINRPLGRLNGFY